MKLDTFVVRQQKHNMKNLHNKYKVVVIVVFAAILVACNNESVKTSFYDNGNKSSELHYKNEQLNGESIYYYENGTIQSKYTYVNGVLQGASKSWFLNGSLENEISFKDGKLNGEKKIYNMDGTSAYIETYENDKLNGKYISYHSNGKVRIKGAYTNGLYDGYWMYLDRFGRLVGEAEFKLGTGKQKAYYTNGKTKQIVSFKGIFTKVTITIRHFQKLCRHDPSPFGQFHYIKAVSQQCHIVLVR